MSPAHEVTVLLRAWREGDETALEALMPLVHDELQRIARRCMHGERANHVDAPLLAIRPDGTNVELPAIRLRVEGKRYRFLPNGLALVYAQGSFPGQDFWLLDLATKKSRQLSRLNNFAVTQSFDVTADGKQIVFDRVRENSDIVLIDLAQ